MQLGSTGWPTLFLTAWTSEAMRDTEQGVQPHCPQLRDLKYYSGKRCFSKSFYVVSNISGKINHSSGPKTEVRVSKLQSPGTRGTALHQHREAARRSRAQETVADGAWEASCTFRTP